MSSRVRVIGIDPGPTPGIVVMDWAPVTVIDVDVIQCSARTAPTLLAALLEDRYCTTFVQIETFVIGRKSMRSGHAGAVTRDLVGKLGQTYADYRQTGGAEGAWIQRSASQVKPWATDERLDAAGLLEACKGMRHARDAARHALYAACRDAGLPDPLSTRSTPR